MVVFLPFILRVAAQAGFTRRCFADGAFMPRRLERSTTIYPHPNPPPKGEGIGLAPSPLWGEGITGIII
ncbi:MAG: hypothetical protein IAF02_04720 [Anaerolineae bacterium]|nr:hypothetical protein [Anaerolineae bacterium]